MFCIIAANQAHVRREASIAALYSLYEGKYRDYKGKNRELFGEENDKRVEEEVLKDKLHNESLYPEKSEGELTKLRASLVCEYTLSQITKEYDFGKYLCYNQHN